jgi:putative copper export protein
MTPWPDIVLRGLTIGAICVLIGTHAVTALVLEPVAGPAAGRRLRSLLTAATVVLLAATAATLLRLLGAMTAVAPGQPLAATATALLTADIGAWTALRLPAGLALLAWYRTAGGGARPVAGWAGPAALLALSLPMTGHAWSRGGPAAVAAGVVHVTAGSIWLAGVAALVIAGRSPGGRAALAGLGRRFSRIALAAVTVTAASGALAAALDGVRPGALAGTAWGTAGLVKAGLLVAVLGAGLVNHRVLLVRLERARDPAAARAGARLLLASIGAEAALGAALVATAALLVSVPQP